MKKLDDFLRRADLLIAQAIAAQQTRSHYTENEHFRKNYVDSAAQEALRAACQSSSLALPFKRAAYYAEAVTARLRSNGVNYRHDTPPYVILSRVDGEGSQDAQPVVQAMSSAF